MFALWAVRATRRVSPFFQEDSNPTYAVHMGNIFISSHDRSNAKKDFWFQPPKEPLQRVTTYTSLLALRHPNK